MEPVFRILKTDLGYSPDRPALHIEELEIKRGELTFVIGPSGAGKSTLLESLGLMKNTIQSGSSSQMNFYDRNGESYSMLDIWSGTSERAAQLRSKNFSFIFQSTNLMPNFTLGENICFTGMLEGESLPAVKKKALDLMAELNLDAHLFDQPATMASGGQRQRAAFVRALCKDYEVLFGDEPTGNLDRENAISLFTLLKEHIKADHRSAIIVSHDIELSERFADKIIRIELDTSRGKEFHTGLIRK